MHPSLIAGEDHCEAALEGRNLVVEAMLIAIEDANKTLAELLVGWILINNMSNWCSVVELLCLLNPYIALIL